MTLVRAAAVALAMAVSATASGAEEQVTGRWAVDEAACGRWFGSTADSPLVVSDHALRWASDACRIERSYKAEGTVHIQAMCWGDGGEKSVPVSLRPQGGKLLVSWDRGARGALKRCP